MQFLIKQTVKLLPVVMILLSTATAQTKQNSFQTSLGASYKSIVPVKNKQTQAEFKKPSSAIQQSVDELGAATKKSLLLSVDESEKTNKELVKTYPAKKTSIDLITDLAAAPSPVSTLSTAAKTDVDAMYKPYYTKLEQRKNQLTEIANKNNLYQDVYNKEGQAGLEKRAAAEADKNAIVREMGGAEKLKNMTEAERKQAAEQMKAKLQQNPAMLTGNSPDAGMKAMQQKLMSDPAYAKKFSNMTEDEKQAEMKKYMTLKPQEGAATRTSVKSQDQQDAEKAVEIGLLMERTAKRLEAATVIYNRMTLDASKVIEDMRVQLSNWVSVTTKSIPMVELGEYGHDRDPEMMSALEITAKQARYAIAGKEIELRAICWNQYKSAISAALLEFNNYAGDYKWGQAKDNQLFNGTYNDPKIVSAYAGYYGTIMGVAQSSDKITTDAKNAQKIFEGLL